MTVLNNPLGVQESSEGLEPLLYIVLSFLAVFTSFNDLQPPLCLSFLPHFSLFSLTISLSFPSHLSFSPVSFFSPSYHFFLPVVAVFLFFFSIVCFLVVFHAFFHFLDHLKMVIQSMLLWFLISCFMTSFLPSSSECFFILYWSFLYISCIKNFLHFLMTAIWCSVVVTAVNLGKRLVFLHLLWFFSKSQ